MAASGLTVKPVERGRDRFSGTSPLEQIFSIILEMVECQLPGARVALMRYHAATQTLHVTGQSSFAPPWAAQRNGLPVGLAVGTCGRAAAIREPVVTVDIEQDPLWSAYRHMARHADLRACWSVPILSEQGVLFGTLAVYYQSPREPSAAEQSAIDRAADLLALAFVRQSDLDRQQLIEQRYQSLFFYHPDGVFELDTQGGFVSCNAAFERITGLRRSDLTGRSIFDYVIQSHAGRIEYARECAIQGIGDHCEVCLVQSDGNTLCLYLTMLPIVVDDAVLGVYGVCRDATADKQRGEKLRLLERAIEANVDGISIADARDDALPLVYVNRAFLRLTGYPREEVLGRNCNFLQGPDTDQAVRRRIRNALAARRDMQLTLLNYRKNGETFWNRLSLSAVFDEAGQCTHFVGIQQDVTDQKEREALLSYQATHDLLTGLLTQQALLQHIMSMRRVVVLHIDLDGFAEMNDYVGYAVGNALLKAVSRRLLHVLGSDAAVARLYGDCFAAALPDLRPGAACAERIDAVRGALSMPFDDIGGQTLQLSASIGAAYAEHGEYRYDTLLREAESAAREAKRQGRNTWQWFVPADNAPENEYVVLRRELQQALGNEQLTLYYQPIVAAEGGELKSLEALVRWQHPTRGVLGPGLFMPLAEATGQIIQIGAWVLRRACADIAAQRRDHGPDVRVAINVSPLQFRRPGFLDVVRAALDDYGLEGEALEIEVTEGVLISGADRTIGLINDLRAMGVHVAIDDFGTGYSSLSYLRDLPITKVKLDIGFVRDIAHSRANAAIVEAVVSIAEHLGLEVVAEGVESVAQRDALIGYGCGLLQGFLFSAAQPLDVIARGPRYFRAVEG